MEPAAEDAGHRVASAIAQHPVIEAKAFLPQQVQRRFGIERVRTQPLVELQPVSGRNPAHRRLRVAAKHHPRQVVAANRG